MTTTTNDCGIDDLLKHMAGEAKKFSSDSTPAMVQPRDSASMIILDRSTKSPKVLMGRRHQNHRFMPGVFVFPGGAVEPSDRKMPVAGALSARVEEALNRKVSRPPVSFGRILALTAIRETYEETGLMLGTRDYGAPEAPEQSVWESFSAAGIFPTIEGLSFIARAITPPGKPKRFDTRFFVADKKDIAEQQEGFIHPDAELTELVWLPLREAEDLDMPLITRTILMELRQRILAGMSEMLPVPFYRVAYHKAVREVL